MKRKYHKVHNIAVKHCRFMGTNNGLRFKSTHDRGGIVENIYITNIVYDGILYNLYYAMNGDKNIPMPPVDEGTPQFRNIYMHDIICEGAYRAILSQSFPEMSLKDIYLEKSVIESRTGVLFYYTDPINMKNVKICTSTSPVIEIENACNIKIDGFKFDKLSGSLVTVSGEKTSNVTILNSGIIKDKITATEVKNGAVQSN